MAQTTHSKVARMLRIGQGGLSAQQVKEVQAVDPMDGHFLGQGSEARMSQLVAGSIGSSKNASNPNAYW